MKSSSNKQTLIHIKTNLTTATVTATARPQIIRKWRVIWVETPCMHRLLLSLHASSWGLFNEGEAWNIKVWYHHAVCNKAAISYSRYLRLFPLYQTIWSNLVVIAIITLLYLISPQKGGGMTSIVLSSYDNCLNKEGVVLISSLYNSYPRTETYGPSPFNIYPYMKSVTLVSFFNSYSRTGSAVTIVL